MNEEIKAKVKTDKTVDKAELTKRLKQKQDTKEVLKK